MGDENTSSPKLREAPRVPPAPEVPPGRGAKEELDYPPASLSRERKRELLKEMAESLEVSARDRIKAIEVDNKMAGDNAPEKHELSGGADPLLVWLQGASKTPLSPS